MEIVILFYKQIFGTPMSLPLSPIIAEIVLQNFEVHTSTWEIIFTIIFIL